MKINSYNFGPIDTNSYLLIDDNKNAVLIDAPPYSFEPINKICNDEEINLLAILLTHSHWDHSADSIDFQSKMNVPIYINELDEYRMLDPIGNALWKLPFDIKPCKADKYFVDNEVLKFGDITLKVIFTPGHTQGGTSLYDEKNKVLFSGDTLFNLGIGRTDLPGGDYPTLRHSINEVLYKLPDSTVVYPGHGDATNIGYEKHHNRI